MAKQESEKARPEIPEGLVRALAESKASADSEALLTDLIEFWGGTRQLALDLHREFHNAPTGGMTLQRIPEMIEMLVVTNASHQTLNKALAKLPITRFVSSASMGPA
jgi:hypothetical protein